MAAGGPGESCPLSTRQGGLARCPAPWVAPPRLRVPGAFRRVRAVICNPACLPAKRARSDEGARSNGARGELVRSVATLARREAGALSTIAWQDEQQQGAGRPSWVLSAFWRDAGLAAAGLLAALVVLAV